MLILNIVVRTNQVVSNVLDQLKKVFQYVKTFFVCDEENIIAFAIKSKNIKDDSQNNFDCSNQFFNLDKAVISYLPKILHFENSQIFESVFKKLFQLET